MHAAGTSKSQVMGFKCNQPCTSDQDCMGIENLLFFCTTCNEKGDGTKSKICSP